MNHGKGQFRIKLNKTNARLLLPMIEKYKHPTLEYKFILDYDNYKLAFDTANKGS